MNFKKKAKLLLLGLATSLTVFCGAFCSVPMEAEAMGTDGTYKYLAIGNSITVHPIRPFWWGNWGMAATSPDKDYVHIISSFIEQHTGSVSTSSIYYVDWEHASSGAGRNAMLSQLDGLLSPDLDLVTIQLGENISDTTYMQQDFQNLMSYVWSKAPNARIIMIGQFWQNGVIDSAKIAASNYYGVSYVNLSAIWGPEYRVGVGTTVWGADGFPHVISDDAVGQHPNDAAMSYIANEVNRLLVFEDYSSVFDAAYYADKYDDLKAAYGYNRTLLLRHFLSAGINEGRQASPNFYAPAYKARYADLRAAFGNDMLSYARHYINNGRQEGRNGAPDATCNCYASGYNGVDYSSVYDYEYYSSKYGDLVAAFGNDDVKFLQHFINCGMAEGRQAKSSFNVFAYRAKYKDLRTAFGYNLPSYYHHYIDCGRFEGRVATGSGVITDGVTVLDGVDYSSVYNYAYYILNNGDVAAAFGNDDEAVLRHFVDCGMAEGRQAIANFNVRAYKNTYSDLRFVFGTDLKLYYLHYINCGRAEGRVATQNINSVVGAVTALDGVDYSAVYNYAYYIANNGDVAATFGNDDVAVLRHFVDCGMAEGRQASVNFNVNVYKANYGDLQATFGGDNKAYYLHYINCGLAEGRSAK